MGNDLTFRVWDVSNVKQLACLNMEGNRYEVNFKSIVRCCWNDDYTLRYRGDVLIMSPPLSIYNTSNQLISLCKFKMKEDYWAPLSANHSVRTRLLFNLFYNTNYITYDKIIIN